MGKTISGCQCGRFGRMGGGEGCDAGEVEVELPDMPEKNFVKAVSTVYSTSK